MRASSWIASAAALAFAAAAAAGPEWVEGTNSTGDAGGTPGGSQTTRGAGTLTKIAGELTSLNAFAGGGPVDFEDVYLIRISDPDAFFATTSFFPGTADFESSLYLFRPDGFGVLGNQFTAFPPEGSGKFVGSTLGSSATDSTGAMADDGLVLLGVTITPRQPRSGSGEIFDFDMLTETSGPDGPGANGPLSAWNGMAPPEGPGPISGSYVISLGGATFAQLTGACCFTDGSCLDDTGPDDCAAQNGIHLGGGTTCAGAPCVADPAVVSGSEKGSLLIFSKVEIRWDASGNVLQDTFIDIANDFPEDVQVKMYFINGDPPLAADPGPPAERAHAGWNWVNNAIPLTQNEPTYWSALTGLPKGVSPFTVLDPGVPPGRPDPAGTNDRVLRGYILAWAINASGVEIRWNHLKGDAILVNYRDNTAWEYNAWAIAAVGAGTTNGSPTSTPGVLALTGGEYATIYSQLVLDFYAVGSQAFSGGNPFQLIEVVTDLTLHPVSADLRQETDGPVCTKAHFDVWNMNETKFSGAYRCICCWDQTWLADYDTPNHFLLGNLQTDKGRARIDGLPSQLCDDGPTRSSAAALLGLAAKHLDFQFGASFASSGVNLHGLGRQSAFILYDVVGPPPESSGPASPFGAEQMRGAGGAEDVMK